MRSIVILFRLLVIGVASSAFVVVLFLLSENSVHRNNSFVRRYPHHPITKKYDLPIKYNSYYIAGYENEMLYLGNTTAPLHLLKVNLKTRDTSHIRIKLDKTDLPFRSVEVNLHPPYFFVLDGTIPFIFRGRIGDWKAHLWMKDKAYFSKAIAIDSNKIYISTVRGKTQMTTIGLIEKEDEDDFNVILNSNILEKQIDGIFDVDGIMAVSPNHKELGYIYFYRNQFMLMDSKLKLLKRQRTIDTVQKAQIKLSETNDKGEIKMKAPPIMVNKMATIYNDLLLINSNRLGKYEDKDMLKEASIIDVYNWKKESYEFSFYLYHIGNERAKEFSLHKGYLIALIDDKLAIYELVKQHFSSDLSFKYSQKINHEGSYRK
ncbi:MAG: hypothetical protein CVU01_01930 [Bacteroidetes bacterium HGW-Bacteroidetes-18]|nr:MAG: hypothetical protein CVU01_01930 [Bacteroidetes bacterium HGW-Bacteroidetes-18]